jgi:hypothetical protein
MVWCVQVFIYAGVLRTASPSPEHEIPVAFLVLHDSCLVKGLLQAVQAAAGHHHQHLLSTCMGCADCCW